MRTQPGTQIHTLIWVPALRVMLLNRSELIVCLTRWIRGYLIPGLKPGQSYGHPSGVKDENCACDNFLQIPFPASQRNSYSSPRKSGGLVKKVLFRTTFGVLL